MKYNPINNVRESQDSEYIELDNLDIEDEFQDDKYDRTSIIPQTDDPLAPSLTLRVLVLGSLWCIFLGVVNSILAFRTTPFEIPAFLATLLSYPMGIFMAKFLPNYKFRIANYEYQLNPGSFGMKEHVLITIIASCGGGIAYGIDNVVTQRSTMFMGNTSITFLESLGWVMTTQFLGFGIAGLARRFLVKPQAMVWPGILSTVALFVGFHTSHENDETSVYKLSRFNFFWIAFALSFAYAWIPQYFMVALQSFNIFCFLGFGERTNFLFSSDNGYGLGVGSLTLDWYYVKGSALTTPWWATVNIAFSNFIWGWILTPLVFFTNAFGKDQELHIHQYSDGRPIPVLNSAALFNSSGFHISAVSLYEPPKFNLNEDRYQLESPIYISSFFALAYAASFLSIVAAFTHVFLWHGNEIYVQLNSAIRQMEDSEEDIHNKLMKRYPDISEYSFIYFLLALILLQFIISGFTSYEMPFWSVLLCIAMAVMSVLPIGIITAISGTRLGINVLTEFVIGLLLPGKTVVVMAFKSLGTNSVIQAITLLADLKLGHYMKINPLHMVFAQLYGTFLGAFVNTATSFWVMDSLDNILGTGDWQATDYFVFYNAGAIWGAIGPQRFFGIGSVYESTLWCFAIGFFLPIIPWYLNKLYPLSFWKMVNIPLLSSFFGPGQFQNFYLVPVAVAWFFQSYLFKNYNLWYYLLI
ncbi:hypothetical protein HDV06_001789 [Boothiomyces sp. JEL0866]|nr:hypothetical protein HDV06_001789 [Boothiomyces sp. JEL0866]